MVGDMMETLMEESGEEQINNWTECFSAMQRNAAPKHLLHYLRNAPVKKWLPACSVLANQKVHQ